MICATENPVVETSHAKIREEVGIKLRNARERLMKTRKEVANAIGVDDTTIRNVEAGKGGSKSTLRRMAEYLGLPIGDVAPAAGASNLKPSAITTAPLRRVPIINKIPAGLFVEKTDLGYPAGIADEYIDAPVGNAQCFAMWVDGDSMSPRYEHGDLVIFRAVDLHEESIIDGGDYAICYDGDRDGECSFKRLHIEKNAVVARPINPKTRPARVVVDMSQVIRLGVVLWVAPRIARRK